MSARRAAIAGRNNHQTRSVNRYQKILDEAWQAHTAPRDPDAPTVISTFAGAGGSSLGYSMAGYRELLAVEWDRHAVETLRRNFKGMPVYHGDIAKLSATEVFQRTGLRASELDVFDGSPPCQGFSTAGRRQFHDPRNMLFREYVRLLEGLQPKVFVMENVSGMVRGAMKLVFAEALRALKGAGYKVSVRLMDAQYFDVPQRRQRLIFIGVRNDLGIEPSHPKGHGRIVSCGEALEGVVPRIMAPVPKGAEIVFPYIRPGESAIHVVPREILAKYAPRMVRNTTFSFRSMCRRLHPDKPSHTITKTWVPYSEPAVHPYEHRCLSVEELSNLASFGPCFEWPGKFIDIYARIGNSVPPLFMRAIAGHIRTEILGR